MDLHYSKMRGHSILPLDVIYSRVESEDIHLHQKGGAPQ